MLSTMLADGLGVFVHPGSAAQRRLDAGLTRPLFVRTLVVTALVSAFGFVLPELNGVREALDEVTGAGADSALGQTTGGLMLFAVSLAGPAALIAWRGPAIAARLSQIAGGSADPFAAAVWIYLGTAASLVVTLGVAVSDLLAGMLGLFSPTLAGWLALLTAIIGTLAVVAAASALARAVLGVPGPVRALLLTCSWLFLAIAVTLAVWLPFLPWIA